LGLPLAIVAVVGLWTPGLVQDLLVAVGAVLGGSRV